MDEHIRTVIAPDEAEPFRVVKPLHFTLDARHVRYSSVHSIASTERMDLPSRPTEWRVDCRRRTLALPESGSNGNRLIIGVWFIFAAQLFHSCMAYSPQAAPGQALRLRVDPWL